MKTGHTGVKRVFFASKYSLQGLCSAWKYDAAIRQEVSLFIGGEWYELSVRAKGIGSAAVFVAIGLSMLAWLCILV